MKDLKKDLTRQQIDAKIQSFHVNDLKTFFFLYISILQVTGRLAYSYNPSVREACYWNDLKAIYTNYEGFMVNLRPQ